MVEDDLSPRRDLRILKLTEELTTLRAEVKALREVLKLYRVSEATLLERFAGAVEDYAATHHLIPAHPFSRLLAERRGEKGAKNEPDDT